MPQLLLGADRHGAERLQSGSLRPYLLPFANTQIGRGAAGKQALLSNPRLAPSLSTTKHTCVAHHAQGPPKAEQSA